MKQKTMRMTLAAHAGCLLLLALRLAAASSYDPLRIPDPALPKPLDLEVSDTSRRREIPIRVFLPAERAPAPVLLFSHGLGGSREGNAFLARHWAGRGYAAVFVQHPGSDTEVWREAQPAERMQALHRAASARNYLLRVKDIPAVIDQLERWNGASGHPLAGRLDLIKIGMSGHSFGAVTTQAVSGQKNPMTDFRDPRIRAAIAFSPSAPRRGDSGEAFGQVDIPWLLMTGSKDIAAIGAIDMGSRLAVFPSLPPGGKYEVVLHNAEHSAFTDRPLPGDSETRNPNHHRAILALSSAFWDAWLRGDAEARAWIDGAGPRSLLEKNDRWQTK